MQVNCVWNTRGNNFLISAAFVSNGLYQNSLEPDI